MSGSSPHLKSNGLLYKIYNRIMLVLRAPLFFIHILYIISVCLLLTHMSNHGMDNFSFFLVANSYLNLDISG